MDATPIYTELQQTLADPEADNWGLSAPPEFAAALAERAERTQRASKKETAGDSATASSRRGGHRHRAED